MGARSEEDTQIGAYRCETRTGDIQCNEEATHVLVDMDGEPAARVCSRCEPAARWLIRQRPHQGHFLLITIKEHENG